MKVLKKIFIIFLCIMILITSLSTKKVHAFAPAIPIGGLVIKLIESLLITGGLYVLGNELLNYEQVTLDFIEYAKNDNTVKTFPNTNAFTIVTKMTGNKIPDNEPSDNHSLDYVVIGAVAEIIENYMLNENTDDIDSRDVLAQISPELINLISDFYKSASEDPTISPTLYNALESSVASELGWTGEYERTEDGRYVLRSSQTFEQSGLLYYTEFEIINIRPMYAFIENNLYYVYTSVGVLNSYPYTQRTQYISSGLYTVWRNGSSLSMGNANQIEFDGNIPLFKNINDLHKYIGNKDESLIINRLSPKLQPKKLANNILSALNPLSQLKQDEYLSLYDLEQGAVSARTTGLTSFNNAITQGKTQEEAQKAFEDAYQKGWQDAIANSQVIIPKPDFYPNPQPNPDPQPNPNPQPNPQPNPEPNPQPNPQPNPNPDTETVEVEAGNWLIRILLNLIDYTGFLRTIISLIQSIVDGIASIPEFIKAIITWFIIDIDAISQSIPSMDDILEKIPIISQFRHFSTIIRAFNIGKNYEYPKITIETPAVLRPHLGYSIITLVDFADYEKYMKMARNIIEATLYIGFGFYIMKMFKVRLKLG